MKNMAEELNLNEMTEASGGKGGPPNPLPAQSGLKVYKIKSGDRLGRIASAHKTTVDFLMSVNPPIKNKNDITAGFAGLTNALNSSESSMIDAPIAYLLQIVLFLLFSLFR